MKDVKKADADENGSLSKEEFNTMPQRGGPVVVADEADPVVVAVDLAVAHAVAVMLKSASRKNHRSRLFLEKGRFLCSGREFLGDFGILFLNH